MQSQKNEVTASSDWILWEPVLGQFTEMSSKRLKHKIQKLRHFQMGLYFWKHSVSYSRSHMNNMYLIQKQF